jgi:hypothetical protein
MKNSSKILAFPVRFRLQHADTDTPVCPSAQDGDCPVLRANPAADDFETNINR